MVKKKYSKILIEANKKEDQAITTINTNDPFTSRESSEFQIRLDGLSDYYEMRRSWGNFLKICLGVILIFNISLVLLVGFGFLKYQDDWFLRIVLTTNLADIIGLVFLVVKFLFSNNLDKTYAENKVTVG